MGCYGLGISRILASVIEVLSTAEEIRWPLPLAPYLIAIIPPKVKFILKIQMRLEININISIIHVLPLCISQAGSKEEEQAKTISDELATKLNEILPNDIVVDDRTEDTNGRRLKDLKMLGVPYILVLGKGLTATPGRIELHDVNAGSVSELVTANAFDYCSNLKKKWNFLS